MADVLVIDDDPSMRRLIGRMLRSAGHQVREAGGGREGLELFNEARPDLVVTDIFMPEGEGIETVRAMYEAAPSVPILVISGGGEGYPDYSGFAVELGAAAKLAKPFTRAQLLERVTGLLEGARPIAS